MWFFFFYGKLDGWSIEQSKSELEKGGLISEESSIWFHPQKKVWKVKSGGQTVKKKYSEKATKL